MPVAVAYSAEGANLCCCVARLAKVMYGEPQEVRKRPGAATEQRDSQTQSTRDGAHLVRWVVAAIREVLV